MRNLNNAFLDLGGSFYVLHKNDSLLRQKIKSLSLQTIYTDIISEYFQTISDDSRSNVQRTSIITEQIEKLWVSIHGKPDTYLVFENFNSLEKILFKLPDYRGHYIHQFNVFLLGYYLINKLIENEQIKENFRKYTDKINFVWMLASTFHDMGYPIQELENLFSMFIDMFLKVSTKYHMNIDDILTSNFYNYVEYLSEIHYQFTTLNQNQWGLNRNCRKDYRFLNLILTKLRAKDHGVISALLLIHSVLSKEKFINREQWLNRDFPFYIMPACHAISVHNLRTDDICITFNETPFAFLLILCDEMQDWGRSKNTIDQSELLDVIVNNTLETPKIEFKIRVNSAKKINSLELLKKNLSSKNIDVKIIAEYNNEEIEFVL